MSARHCTIKEIAHAAQVSISTVSYALRNHPRIPPVTCRRIQAIAKQMGYQRNPHVSALMSLVGKGRTVNSTEHIALIWPQGHPQTAHSEICQQILDGVSARAESLGYGVEQFWMEEDKLSAARLTTILATRNIRGLVFAPAFRSTSLKLDFDWSQFSTVVMGYAQWEPEMHRALPNHYNSVRQCLEYLIKNGAKNPAAVFSKRINLRTDFAQEAAFITHHPQPNRAQKLIFFHDETNLDELPAWLRSHRIDSVIFGRNEFFHTCRQQCPRVLSKLKQVTMEWEHNHQSLPGIHQRYDHVGMAAVDLLSAQLQINETGAPERPKILMLGSDWKDAAKTTSRKTKSPTRKR